MVDVLSQSRWSHCLTTGVNLLGGEFIGLAIRKVVHPTGSNRLVDNPQVEKSHIHRIDYCYVHCMYSKIYMLKT